MIVDRHAYDAMSLPALPESIELPAGADQPLRARERG